MIGADAALGLAAIFGLLCLAPAALAYLGWVQRRRHLGSSLALFAAALAIGAWLFAAGPGWAAAARALDGWELAGLGALTLAAVGWKLALRRRPGARDGETIAERLLPLLIAADLLLLLLAWPAVSAWRAALVGG